MRLLDHAPVVVWTTDTELRLTSWLGGGLKTLGSMPSQHLGADLYAFFGTRDSEHPAIRAHRRALLGESSSYEVEREGLWGDAQVAPILDAAHEVRGVMGMALETTPLRRADAERRRLAVELEESRRHVDALCGRHQICSRCRCVREAGGGWRELTEWLSDHAPAVFSHGICPSCLKRL